jgi:hypothetical protein
MVMTRRRHGYAFVAKDAVLIWGAVFLEDFFKGQEKVDGESAAHRVEAG